MVPPKRLPFPAATIIASYKVPDRDMALLCGKSGGCQLLFLPKNCAIVALHKKQANK
jgi:hypothetical protein